MKTDLYKDYFDTPLGMMEITANDEAVTSIFFVDQFANQLTRPLAKPQLNKLTQLAKQQLLEYYTGERQEFDLPLSAKGTKFQKSVWAALSKVNYAATCCYADIAESINKPKAVRAVGAANGKNPLTIVVPCHRVIGRDGSLTGYASGLKYKAWLLDHEAKHQSG